MDPKDTGKSILDGMPIVETDFEGKVKKVVRDASPLTPEKVKEYQFIVSTCPKCGAPIYGQDEIKKGDSPQIVYSCSCYQTKDFAQVIENK